MLRHIPLIAAEYRRLQRPHLLPVPVATEAQHRLGHSAYKVIIPEQFLKLGREHRHHIPVACHQHFRQVFLSHRHHELHEAHRMKGEEIHFSHGERLSVMQLYPEQRSGSDNMISGSILCKILQRSDGIGSGLYLIEENQRVALTAGHTRHGTYSRENPRNIEILFKEIAQDLHLLKVHISQLPVVSACKLLHEPGLSHLSRSLHYKRFTICLCLPFLEFFDCCPFHTLYF